MITRKNASLCALLLAAITTPGLHAYQFDLEGEFVTLESEFAGETSDVDALAISGQFYLSDVGDSAALPFEELGNFSQISNLGLEIVRVDPEFGDDDTGFALNGQAFIAGSKQFLYGEYSDDADDFKLFTVGYGGFFRDNFQGRVGFVRQDFDDGDGIGVNGTLEAVFAFANGSYLVPRGELTIIGGEIDGFDEDIDYGFVTFEAGLDFYPIKQLGLGIGLSSEAIALDDDADSVTTTTLVSLSANYYINEAFNVGFSYGFGETELEDDFDDDFEIDQDGLSIEAGIRF